MPGKTHINWTEHTWGIFTGCSRIAPECMNCYAETLTGTRLINSPRYKGLTVIRADGKPHFTGEIRFHAELLTAYIKKKTPVLIFTNSMSDPFHENVLRDHIDMFFAAMLLGNQHLYQVLTKRPGRMADYLNDKEVFIRIHRAAVKIWKEHFANPTKAKPNGNPFPAERLEWPLPHVWLGTSVGTQATADKFTPELLRIPDGWLLWWSSEPLIGPIKPRPEWFDGSSPTGNRVQWVIVGGESGNKTDTRPMKEAWADDIRRFCAEHNTPYWFKQPGVWHEIPTGEKITNAEIMEGNICILNDDNTIVRNIRPAAMVPATAFRYGKKEADSPYRTFPAFPASFRPKPVEELSDRQKALFDDAPDLEPAFALV